MVRFLSVTYCPEKYPLTRTHPPFTNAPQELNTSSVSLIWHPSGEGQTLSRRFPSPVCGGAWIEQGARLKKTLVAAPPTRRGEATPKWLLCCRTEGSAGRERGRRGGKVRSGSDRFRLIVHTEGIWYVQILIRIENWCVRARMDFDSNRKLVPVGLYRFLLMVRTVRTEVMRCQPVDKVYKNFQKRLPRMCSSIKTCSRFTWPITSYSFCAYRPRTPHVLCTYPTYVSARTPHVSENQRNIPYTCA